MAVSTDLETALEQVIERFGLELVEIEKAGHRTRPIIRLRVDRPAAEAGTGVTVEECAHVSRELEPMLDAREDLPATYILEVSSPGVERPIQRRRDFERYAGKEISVRGYAPIHEGSKRVDAILLGIEGSGDDERVRLQLGDGREITIPRSAIAKAHLRIRWDEYDFGNQSDN